jgi:hypothetical protein
MKLFLDSSAFAKRYVVEHGSDKVLALCQEANALIVSVICLPEFISTTTRLVREKKISQSNYRKLKENALADLIDVDIVPITPEVLKSATLLMESNILRAMDALHVACAAVAKPDVLVSADKRQLAAAKNMGFQIVDVI